MPRFFNRVSHSDLFSGVRNIRTASGFKLSDADCTLVIQPQDHIVSALERLADVLFLRTFVILVNFGIFDEFSRIDHLLEFFPRYEMVIDSIFLVATRFPAGGCDNKLEGQFPFQQSLDECILPCTGETGENDQ